MRDKIFITLRSRVWTLTWYLNTWTSFPTRIILEYVQFFNYVTYGTEIEIYWRQI